MQKISYARYRFPPLIIQHAVWLYFRFPLSFRDVEDLLAERGIDVSYETVRRWSVTFGRHCQTKRIGLSLPAKAKFQAAPSCLHSARATARFSLKIVRR